MPIHRSYGWVPDLPDQRDHLYAATPEILAKLPPKKDLRSGCPAVYDQGQLGSCTANAISGAIQFDQKKQMNLKRTFRRAACLVTRLAANLGVAGATPVLARFRSPVEAGKAEQRWLEGLYLDVPEEWDDPYRYFRW